MSIRGHNDGMHNRATQLLLNVAHAIDHMFLLIFATAVTTIAADFGFSRWEESCPTAPGILLFGLGGAAAGESSGTTGGGAR